MKQHLDRNSTAFRRAMGASVVLHVVAACGFLLFVQSGDESKPTLAAVDTRATDEPQVQMHLVEDVFVSVDPAPQPTPQPTLAKLPESPTTPATPESPSPTLPDKPYAPVVPQTLPSELLTLMRKVPAESVSVKIETPVPVAIPNREMTDPAVKPVRGTQAGIATPAMHGALKSNQTVVYVLDCSGSMGAAGKLDAARAALAATLKQQPTTVRFQVIVYAGSAGPLLLSDGSALQANEANVRLATEKLATLDARGKSNHLKAIHAALIFRPDVIVLLTDAEELTAVMLKPVLASHSRIVPVWLGHVTAVGVQRLRELK